MARSRKEAIEHITKIRKDKGLAEGASGHNVSDLESALTTLSEQLYQSSTHFLLELIQNADDNTYGADVIPSLEFTYRKGCLRVDCNEVGFSERNVEALCRVGQSTKKGGDNATRYVGEKGIGFKSVFKAADVVWINSGNYSFKFDKSKTLGMIAPIWDEFPDEHKPGYTSLCLQLSNNYNKKRLQDELRALDSRLLIFLRRLQSITVTIYESFDNVWQSTFSRQELENGNIRLMNNGTLCDYIISRHQVSNMPPDPKRVGCTSTEIILGFPVDQDCQPRRESQKAYAFLPIRDYGYEFLIQADFLLIASREDIDESCQWNHAIRKALTAAFINAVRKFNEGSLRYLWPRYLPLRAPLDNFLKPFHLDLKETLSSQLVMYAQSGALSRPMHLTLIPERFTYFGTPITQSLPNAKRYLSNKYPSTDFEYLETLQITEMDDLSFVLELNSMIKLEKKAFTSKSNAWHSHLAGILIRMPPTMSDAIREIDLVPLSDGSWKCSSGRQILFPGGSTDGFELPTGLELSVVEKSAASDPTRRMLFKFLGVGDLEQEPVVKHIQSLHSSERVKSASISNSALISQIKFLYTTGWKNPSFQRFWFTSEFGQRLNGILLYQDSDKKHSATKFFSAVRKKFPFIHKDYLLSAGSDRDSWAMWLEEKMGVATLPRLIQLTSDRGFVISTDWGHISQNFHTSEVLLLLRDNWSMYAKYFDPDEVKECKREDIEANFSIKKFNTSAETLRKELEGWLVTCNDGEKHRLDTTFLPTKELLAASNDGIPFLAIPDANNPKWEILGKLGVSLKADVTFYLRSLEALVGTDDCSKLQDIIDVLNSRSHDQEDAATIKTFFTSSEKEIIYIPAIGQEKHKWIKFSDCRWKGLAKKTGYQHMKTFCPLRDIYPDNKRFFCDVLGVQDATLEDFAAEAMAFEIGNSLAHVTSIFHAMEKFLEDDDNRDKACKFRNITSTSNIWPVSMNWKTETDLVTKLERCLPATFKAESDDWFVADTAPLRTIFAGIVPLLDIKIDDLIQMDHVMTELNVKPRFLSKKAESVPRTKGVVELNEELTGLFRSKIDFIIRLIPTTKQNRVHRRKVIRQLENLQVYTADEVIQEWRIMYKGKYVKGPPGNGNVALFAEKETFKIYLAAKSGFQIGDMPLELVDEIFNYCGMQPHNPEHSEMCLHIALSQHNQAKIMKIFADKGIPSLEGLRFADDEEIEEDEEEEAEQSTSKGEKGGKSRLGRWWNKDSKGESSTSELLDAVEYPKKKRFGALSAAGVNILGAPVGLAMGIGGLAKKAMGSCTTGNDEDSIVDADGDGDTADSKSKKGKAKEGEKSSSEQSEFQKALARAWARFQEFTITSEDIAFKGEYAVHTILSLTLGTNYNPTHHWTSPLRSKTPLDLNIRGHPFQTNRTNSSFTFSDRTGAFTHLLNQEHYPGASKWITRPPTYHIDVKSTRGDKARAFSLSPEEWQRAKKYSVLGQKMRGEECPRNVYILVRVWDIGVREEGQVNGNRKGKEREVDDGMEESGEVGEPKMLFLVDPWEYYQADRLKVEWKGDMVVSIT